MKLRWVNDEEAKEAEEEEAGAHERLSIRDDNDDDDDYDVEGNRSLLVLNGTKGMCVHAALGLTERHKYSDNEVDAADVGDDSFSFKYNGSLYDEACRMADDDDNTVLATNMYYIHTYICKYVYLCVHI